MKKRALITGVTGQDGSYLAEYLIGQDYDVYGLYRRVSTGNNFNNIKLIKEHPKLHLVPGDICDHAQMQSLMRQIQPTELYLLAAMSHVGQSFKEPIQTFRVDAEATIGALEAVRQESPMTRVYFAATSELFGGMKCPESGYNEESPIDPRSPYAVAKAASFYAVRNYREAYDLHCCSGILFNHESPRRGLDFAPRKITKGVASVKLGLQDRLDMGNMDAYRDIGHSKDYVRAMHLMLQEDKPQDFVIATGESVSIREMLAYVCELAELKYEDVYRMDKRYMRPSDVPYLKGDGSKAEAILDWTPSYSWRDLLREMYLSDLTALQLGCYT